MRWLLFFIRFDIFFFVTFTKVSLIEFHVCRKPSAQMVEHILALDNTLLTMALPSFGDRPNMTVAYVRFSELENYTHSSFKGDMLLSAINRVLPADRQLSSQDELLVAGGAYLRLLGRYLGEHSESMDMRGYVSLLLARYLAPSASFSLLSAHLPEKSADLAVGLTMIGRCLQDAVLMMSYILGDMFVDWYLGEAELAGARDIVDRLRAATENGFNSISWIDERTRKGALRTLHTMEELVGHPRNLSEDAQLTEYYSFLPQLSQSYPAMLTAARDKQVERLRGLIKKSEPHFSPVKVELPMILVNAFYVPIYHMMVIPPAIMFAPFYRNSVPSAYSYGSLGHVVGHEITHAFDREVGIYNESALPSDWWTNGSLTVFNDNVECLKVLYNNVSWAQGYPFGTTAFSENFADCGGMQRAFRAFKTLGTQAAQNIGSREYTGDQVFFINSCYKWCSKRPNYTVQVDTEVFKLYSPMNMRCNVPLMNMPEFAETFRCERGKIMNPEKRCTVF